MKRQYLIFSSRNKKILKKVWGSSKGTLNGRFWVPIFSLNMLGKPIKMDATKKKIALKPIRIKTHELDSSSRKLDST